MNLDCNLQTADAKPAIAFDVGKQHVDTHSLTLFT